MIQPVCESKLRKQNHKSSGEDPLYTGRIILLLIVFGLICPEKSLVAQIGTPFNQRDDQYRLLGLKRAKAAYEAAKADLERQKDLYENNLISEKEFLQARNIFADAEVNYQQSLLAVLFEKQYVTVARAVKYRDHKDQKRVRLTLANASGSAEFSKLLNIEDQLFRSLQPDVINDIYVSLLNDQNAIVSQPYEAKIEELHAGKPQTIDFLLLQDLDVVTVNLVYSNGTTRSPKILLEKDASENKVMIQSAQFSQEVELGASATYDLTLELFSGQTNTFKLAVVNLPGQINHYFMDPASNARLSQFRFTESSNSRQAELRIFMPDRPVGEVAIGRSISIFVLVIPDDRKNLVEEHGEAEWKKDEIEALNIGYVALELIPRGVGKLLVRAPQLYQQTELGHGFEMQIILKNEGSRRLDNVEVDADVPLNWQKEIAPPIIPMIGVGEEQTVSLRFRPPEEIVPGKYEMRIRTRSFADNQPVSGDDKIFTAEIKAGANTTGIVIVILLILGLVSGIIVYGIRLTRR